MSNQGEHDLSKMALNKTNVILLFIYYMFIIILGIYLSITSFMIDITNRVNVLEDLLFLTVSGALTGSAIFYVRKLYKSLIQGSYDFSVESIWQQRVGTLAFYIFRPLIAVAFSILTFSIWIGSLKISTSDAVEISWSSTFFVYPLGFFSGFAAGKLLRYFEEKGRSPLDTVIT